jgi:hypothetical protein
MGAHGFCVRFISCICIFRALFWGTGYFLYDVNNCLAIEKTKPDISTADYVWNLQTWNSLWNDKESRELAESVSGWLKEPLQLTSEEPLNGAGRPIDYEAIKYDREVQLNMPIWLAARQAIPRYEAILSSAGSRGLLLRRILMRMGLLQSENPSQTLPITDESESVLEPHLRLVWQTIDQFVCASSLAGPYFTVTSLRSHSDFVIYATGPVICQELR